MFDQPGRLGRLAGILTNVGIIISLIYVGYEVRQNTHIARLQTHEASIRFLHDLSQPLIDEIEDETDLRARANLDLDSLSTKDLARYSALIANYFNLYEMNYYAFERGLMEEEIWTAWKSAMESDLERNPGMVELWATASAAFGDGFRAVVEGMVDRR